MYRDHWDYWRIPAATSHDTPLVLPLFSTDQTIINLLYPMSLSSWQPIQLRKYLQDSNDLVGTHIGKRNDGNTITITWCMDRYRAAYVLPEYDSLHYKRWVEKVSIDDESEVTPTMWGCK